MEIKNVRVYKALVALILAGTTVFTLSSCGKKETIVENVSTAFVIENFADNTYLDTLMGEDLFKNVEQLENYLKYSKELHSLELEKDDINLETIKVEAVENLDNYEKDVTEYKKLCLEIDDKTELNDRNIELYILRKKMQQYDEKVNSWLEGSGYSITEQYGILAIKSLVMKATGATFDQIIIDPNSEWRYDTNSVTIERNGKKETFNFEEDTTENSIVNSIMRCQENLHAEDPVDGEYNETRNEIFEGVVNNIKLTIPDTYMIKENNIKSVLVKNGSEELIENASNNVVKSGKVC